MGLSRADRPELQVGCKHTMPTYADCDSDRTVATFFWARAEQAGTKVCSDSAFDSIAGSVMIARLGRSKQFKLTEGPDNFRHLPLLQPRGQRGGAALCRGAGA